ncbi:SHOCT domain-containing protein [Enterococcus nangangensis]|uniref:SHOCT domain-containing protein n=1 Tax=Enterococcus nangangensis TaxID=2559926 RepID=UPI0010F712A9|nr:SHOCT domain-containing protein [Enterococcus nangangensis]
MGLFGKKETCPLCNNTLGITRFKFKLDNGDFICHDCAVDLAGIWKDGQNKLKTMSMAKIRELYHDKGLDVFNPTEKIGTDFMFMSFDDTNKMFSIKPNLTTPEYKGKYEELHSYELIENNEVKTKSGLGKAIIGGVIAGPAGMITGAVIGKGQQGPALTTSLVVKVTLNSGTYYPLAFVSKVIKSDSMAARAAWSNIIRLTDKMDTIIPNAVPNQTIEQSAPPVQVLSSADELRKFKALLDDGIITQDEFDAKKKELLGM